MRQIAKRRIGFVNYCQHTTRDKKGKTANIMSTTDTNEHNDTHNIEPNLKQHADQVGGGVFLVGMGLLFFTGFWWPGIMFVIGASIISSTIAKGKPWQTATGAFAVIGIGLLFWLPSVFSFNLSTLMPVALIGIGLFMLFGGDSRPNISTDDRQKRKNTDAGADSFDSGTYDSAGDSDSGGDD
jgi:hypothetical protein